MKETRSILAEVVYEDEDINDFKKVIEAEGIHDIDSADQFNTLANLIKEKFPKADSRKLWQALVGGDVEVAPVNADFPSPYTVVDFLKLSKTERIQRIYKLQEEEIRDLNVRNQEEIKKIQDKDKRKEARQLLFDFLKGVKNFVPEAETYRMFHVAGGSTVPKGSQKANRYGDLKGDFSVRGFLKLSIDDQKVLVDKMKFIDQAKEKINAEYSRIEIIADAEEKERQQEQLNLFIKQIEEKFPACREYKIYQLLTRREVKPEEEASVIEWRELPEPFSVIAFIEADDAKRKDIFNRIQILKAVDLLNEAA